MPKPTAPQGVRGRNSDNTRLRQVLKWEPQITLEEGLERTYQWIYDQLVQTGRVSSPDPATVRLPEPLHA